MAERELMAEEDSKVSMSAEFPDFFNDGFPVGVPQVLRVEFDSGEDARKSLGQTVVYEFDVEITAPKATVEPEWYQRARIVSGVPSKPIEFTVTPQNGEFKFLYVDLHYANRWMRRITFGNPPEEQLS